MSVQSAIERIEQAIIRRVERVAPFRAIVTAVDGGLITIRRIGASTADTRKYASVARSLLVANDEVLVAQLHGEPVVVDRIRRAAAASPTFAAQAAAGDTASTSGSVGSDDVGLIQLVPNGTGIASGAQIVITFAAAKSGSNYGVWLQALSSAARQLTEEVGPTSRSGSGWTLTSPSALTSGSTYQWLYRVEMYPV